MTLKKVSILGIGLLGGSIGLAVKSRLKGCRVIGYAHRPSTLQKSLQAGVIDEGFDSLQKAVEGADLVILCTPVGVMEPTLREIAPSLEPGTLVTDVGSTKHSIVQAAERLLTGSGEFVGSHPIAGSEKRGVEFARADLFQNALCILTPTAQTDPAALKSVEQFWRDLGMRTTRMSPSEHDQRLAQISHLPHALAAALVAMQSPDALPLAGNGFLDATRIASGDGALWRDILLDNRVALKGALARLRTELNGVESLLDPSKSDELAAWLDRAAALRNDLVRRKMGEKNSE
jgi:prephenate dehydrogenase